MNTWNLERAIDSGKTAKPSLAQPTSELAPIAWTLGLSSHFSLLAAFEFIETLAAEGGMAPAAAVKQL